MNNFKSRVLEPAITQINEKPTLKLKSNSIKTGRSITGFSFKFKQKQTAISEKTISTQRDQNTPDLFTKMTDPQRFLFAHKLSEMPEMSKYSEGTESFQDFAKRIADMLLEPEKFRKFYPFLEKLGFGSKQIAPTAPVEKRKNTQLMITYLLITAVRKISRHSKVMYSILLVKKYKHLKIEGEKMVDFEKELQRCFWTKNSKKYF